MEQIRLHSYVMDAIKQKLNEMLRTEDALKLCILYGSAASDRLTAHSDVDIAIAGSDVLEMNYLADLQVRLTHHLGREVDLVDMHRIEGLILMKILQQGIVLIKKDSGLYANFIRKTIYFEADVLPNIRMILKKRARRFADGH